MNVLPFAQFSEVASSGSPLLVQAFGRAFGLGQAEQTALVSGKVPGWFWATLGIAAGTVIGIQIYKRWPGAVPKVIGGR